MNRQGYDALLYVTFPHHLMMRFFNFKPLVEQTQPAINSSVSCVGVRGYSADATYQLCLELRSAI
jgi:hypothetical protein